jgi:UrcA family protein
MNRTFKLIAAAAVALFSANVAQARDDASPAVTVKYDDLNLKTEAGRAKLEQRIRRAADIVCHVDENERNLGMRQTVQACRDKAIADAMAHASKDQTASVSAFAQAQ